jgi:hypothetical protein
VSRGYRPLYYINIQKEPRDKKRRKTTLRNQNE